MKYCLGCGKIFADSYLNYECETCLKCGCQLTEDTTMTEEQFLQLTEEQKDAYELRIYHICKSSGMFSQKDYDTEHENMADWYIAFRFDKYEQLTGEKAFTKQNKQYHDMESRKRIRDAMEKYGGTIHSSSNKPKCPTCNSTNIKRISTTRKVVNTAMFGVLGTKRHKTFHCNNCRYEW